VLKYCSKLKTEHSEFNQDHYQWGLGEPGEPIYSVPLDEAGYDWRRLCYSGFPVSHQTTECLSMAKQLLQQIVSRCSRLEELAIPLHRRDELEILKREVLPRLPRLQVLHLPWSELADLWAHATRKSPWTIGIAGAATCVRRRSITLRARTKHTIRNQTGKRSWLFGNYLDGIDI
jgi:hypothetical protein